MSMVQFITGLQAKYNALATKNSNALYFITDSGRIYKGDTLVTSTAVKFVSALPQTDILTDTLYVVLGTESEAPTLWYYNGTEFVQAGGGTAEVAKTAEKVNDGAIVFTSFATDVVATAIGEEPSDKKLVTEKAVADHVAAVKEAIEKKIPADVETAFKGVAVGTSETEGKFALVFTTLEGNEVKVDLDKERFMQSASYDTTTHDLTLTMADGSTVVVPLDDLVPQAVNAGEVAMAGEIEVTTTVGNFAKGSTIKVDDYASVQDFLTAMLSQDSNPTVNSKPAVSFTPSPNDSKKEVGTTVTPSVSGLALSKGEYIANGKKQTANVTASAWSVTNNKTEDKLTDKGSFPSIVVTDAMITAPYKITATATGTAGDIPKTYLGKEYDADFSKDVRFEENATYTATKTVVTGFRQGFFWGVLETSTADAPLTSEIIRSVMGKTYGAAKGSGYASGAIGTQAAPVIKANLVTTPKRIFVACPATNTGLTKVQMPSASMYDCTADFVKMASTVSVQGADGATGIAYNVWVYEPAAISADQTFVVTLG